MQSTFIILGFILSPVIQSCSTHIVNNYEGVAFKNCDTLSNLPSEIPTGILFEYCFNHTLKKIDLSRFREKQFIHPKKRDYMLDLLYGGGLDDYNRYYERRSNTYYMDTLTNNEIILIYCRHEKYDGIDYKLFEFKNSFKEHLKYNRLSYIKPKRFFNDYTKEDNQHIIDHVEFIDSEMNNGHVEMEYNDYTMIIDKKDGIIYKIMYVKAGLKAEEIAATRKAYRTSQEIKFLHDNFTFNNW